MNFLSHHFFYYQNDPYYNVGLILPDWSRSAAGKRKVEWIDNTQPNGLELSLLKGCKAHYEGDDWFHNCDFFIQVTDLVAKEIGREKAQNGLFAGQRGWFMAHILTEMLLDRLIIEADAYALDRFYSDLRAVPFKEIEAFLLKSGKTDMGRFPLAHKAFIESEFVRFYANAEGLTESLNRVVQRTGQNAFTEEEFNCIRRNIPLWLDYALQIKKPLQMERLSI
jgi:hypothetical protein